MRFESFIFPHLLSCGIGFSEWKRAPQKKRINERKKAYTHTRNKVVGITSHKRVFPWIFDLHRTTNHFYIDTFKHHVLNSFGSGTHNNRNQCCECMANYFENKNQPYKVRISRFSNPPQTYTMILILYSFFHHFHDYMAYTLTYINNKMVFIVGTKHVKHNASVQIHVSHLNSIIKFELRAGVTVNHSIENKITCTHIEKNERSSLNEEMCDDSQLYVMKITDRNAFHFFKY